MNDKVILRLDQRRLQKRRDELQPLIEAKEALALSAYEEARALRQEYAEVCEELRTAEEKIDSILGDPADGAPSFPIGNA